MGTKMIDRAKLDAAQKSFRATFNEALQNAGTKWAQVATLIPSDAKEEVYNWLGTLPMMQEWLGDRALSRLKGYDYAIKNKKWANGIVVDADDIKYDRLGLVRPRIQQLAIMAERHKDKLIFDLLKGGFAGTLGLAYDGQFFFDTDHQDGNGPVQSNKLTAVFDDAGTALQSAISTMRQFKDEASEPLEIRPTHLVVPPQLEFKARKVLKDSLTTNGGTNTMQGIVDLIVVERLATDATKWYLLALDEPIKPFIMQTVDEVNFRSQDDPSDEGSFMRDEYRYGADYRGNAGYGLWQLAVGSDGTV